MIFIKFRKNSLGSLNHGFNGISKNTNENITFGVPWAQKKAYDVSQYVCFQNEDAGVTKVVCLVQGLRSYIGFQLDVILSHSLLTAGPDLYPLLDSVVFLLTQSL